MPIYLGDPKKYRIDELKPKKQVKLSPIEPNSIKNNELIKRNREDFRRSLVDIIMYVSLKCFFSFLLIQGILLKYFWFNRQDETGKTPVLQNNNDKIIYELDEEMGDDELNEQEREGKTSLRIKASDEPKNIEKDILRYYYYIHNGIDTEHVAPLENIRIQNVLSMIRDKFKKNYPSHVGDLCEEVKEDYLLSVKKAIVDFVLRDSRDITIDEQSKERKVPEYRLELDIVPKPWHASFERARYEIHKNLYSINPCMAQLLKLWHTSFKFAIFIKNIHPLFLLSNLFYISFKHLRFLNKQFSC